MFRLLFRFVGLLVLAGAFAALVVDGTRSVANGALAILPISRSAEALFPTGFGNFHTFVLSHWPRLWEPVFVPLLRLPAWLILGAVGLLVLLVTRRRAPKIGYSRR